MSIDIYHAKYEDCITICKKKTWGEQESCKFSKKSDYRSYCRDFMDINGGICKNIDA